MATAIALTVLVFALLAGTLMSLLKISKTGMPPKDVIERATQRARELEEQEKKEKQEERAEW
jgi:uncharacterized protein YjaG (DUF416 family)